MAESRRQTAQTGASDEEAQKRKDMMFRIFFLLALVGLVGLMILIAKFLSGQ